MCICNGPISAVGFGQVRKGVAEPPLVTAGDDVESVARYLKPGRQTYPADDVIDTILG